MAVAFVGLGSNQAQPQHQLQQAFAQIDQLPHTRLLAQSSLYSSAPIGYLDQPDFVNAVAKVETSLAPHDLLNALLDIEHQHGRERTFRNAPRTLDLDVLLYDDMQLHEHGLTLPHPQMHLRAFVLQPLLEIEPDCVIPQVGRASDALENCKAQRLSKLVA
ncbi:MAG: 2-amino-4-hydroxy-6-hydroxymethyldihydropteridine diphosphokinase [Gallionella sp.]|nr:2-amino-4-hydroxy-6-hydroxymethyldihydropteridine diphosphokinase [Gallionella sp.]MDD4960349.1 2-amino-4-hydroxy-6-hydroxymethyldihydropteridine diphosphokinase [Gallionella sp.]